MTFDERTRNFHAIGGHGGSSIDEGVMSRYIVTALQLCYPSSSREYYDVQHQDTWQVINDHTAVVTTPDIIVQRCPFYIKHDDDGAMTMMMRPGYTRIVVEVKKLKHVSNPIESHKHAIHQLLQSCSFALNDMLLTSASGVVGHAVIGILMYEDGMDVMGVRDGFVSDGDGDGKPRHSAYWCSLASCLWTDAIASHVLRCVIRWSRYTDGDAFILTRNFHVEPEESVSHYVHVSDVGIPFDNNSYEITSQIFSVVINGVSYTAPYPAVTRVQRVNYHVAHCEHQSTPAHEATRRDSIVLMTNSTVTKCYDYYCGYCSLHPVYKPQTERELETRCIRNLMTQDPRNSCLNKNQRRRPNQDLIKILGEHYLDNLKVKKPLENSDEILILKYDARQSYIQCTTHVVGNDDKSKSFLLKKLKTISRDLATLHSHKIVHGDVRACNIIIGPDDDDDAWLIDFDIAQQIPDDGVHVPCYPRTYIRNGIDERADGAVADRPMSMEHDDESLYKMMQDPLHYFGPRRPK